MQKWRAILFGLDSDRLMYAKTVGYPPAPKKKDDPGVAAVADPIEDTGGSPKMLEGRPEIFPHYCFGQIEKDLDRTFALPQFKRDVFEMTLKRIANHFPIMGYTQGINFIVGYLLIAGFSEN